MTAKVHSRRCRVNNTVSPDCNFFKAGVVRDDCNPTHLIERAVLYRHIVAGKNPNSIHVALCWSELQPFDDYVMGVNFQDITIFLFILYARPPDQIQSAYDQRRARLSAPVQLASAFVGSGKQNYLCPRRGIIDLVAIMICRANLSGPSPL